MTVKGPTRDAHGGRPRDGVRLVNPPCESGSTVLFPDYASFRARHRPWHYGRGGTPTHRAFEQSLCALEDAAFASLTGSGLGACALAILSVVRQGGHVLVPDSVYSPTRNVCNQYLADMGVETTFYAPTISPAELKSMVRPETQLVFAESPGSLTFEVPDLPGIIAAAGDVPVAVDNTYSAGVFLKPLVMGAAMSIQAITKYIGGHSDLLMGAVCTNAQYADRVERMARILGSSVSAQDVSLAHRGLRTLHRRLTTHQQNGLALAQWLSERAEVVNVLHPAFDGCLGHHFWQRDATGTTGLFSVIVDWEDEGRTAAFIDALTLFGIGYSWGGFESLCLPAWPKAVRSAGKWTERRQLLRFHAGLEDIDDLTADLDRAFSAAAATS